MSPEYSVDSVLTFVGNNMEGKSITLHHPVGTDAGKVVIENNYLSNITLNNASELVAVTIREIVQMVMLGSFHRYM